MMSPHRRMIATTFIFGGSIGLLASVIYASVVMEHFKFDAAALFQTFTIFAFFGFIAPTARVSITLLLRGLERGDETAGILRDLKTNALPLIEDTKALVAELKGMNVQRVTDLLDRVSKDGTFDKLVKSADGIADKIHDLIKKIEAKAVDGMIKNL